MKQLFLIASILISTSCFSQKRLPGSQSDTGSKIDFSQYPELKADMENMGLKVANQLMHCCSNWGGKNVYATIDYDNCIETASGSFTIPMTVGWSGSMTGNAYWIKGKLVINSNGSREWLKINDSGGFSSGCSNGCIN